MFSCKTTQLNYNVYLTNKHYISLLPTNNFNDDQLITQIITGRYSSNRYSVQAFLSLKPTEISVTAMTPMGNTLYDLTYNSKGITYNALMNIGSKGSAYLIYDIQLCYYPLETIKKSIEDAGLTFSYSILEDGWKREIIDGSKTILTITRKSNIIKYNNILRDYSYTIEEL